MRDAAVTIVRRLQEAGYQACWVGGCVRDMLRGVEPKDYDVATSAPPEVIERLFPRTVAVGRKFGVVLVMQGRQAYEVATFRAEGGYRDGRHPDEVTFTDAQTDASRRDFTVNGLFYDPVQERLHDWVGGEADLRARLLRTIGDPAERFGEDHLRLLRAVRFAAQLDFTVESATWEAVQRLAPRIQGISAERIREELAKLFRPPHAARGLRLLLDSGLLEHVLPELQATVDCQQSPDFHPEGSVFNHLVKMLGYLPERASDILVWAVLLHDVAKPVTAAQDPGGGRIRFHDHERVGAVMAEAVLQRLRFPRRSIEAVVVCVRHHMQLMGAPGMRKATLRRMMMRPTFSLELELHRLDCLGSHGRLDVYDHLRAEWEAFQAQPTLRPPLLTGEDLMALGMLPGPALGDMLRAVRERQLQDELQTPDEARAWVRDRLAGRGIPLGGESRNAGETE